MPEIQRRAVVKGAVWAVPVIAATTALPQAVASPVCEQPSPVLVASDSSGGAATVIVPPNVVSVTITAAGGYGASLDTSIARPDGRGAVVSATFPGSILVEGSALQVIAGGAGKVKPTLNPLQVGGPGYGPGGNGGPGRSFGGGGGSAVLLPEGRPLIVAGGGGGDSRQQAPSNSGTGESITYTFEQVPGGAGNAGLVDPSGASLDATRGATTYGVIRNQNGSPGGQPWAHGGLGATGDQPGAGAPRPAPPHSLHFIFPGASGVGGAGGAGGGATVGGSGGGGGGYFGGGGGGTAAGASNFQYVAAGGGGGGSSFVAPEAFGISSRSGQDGLPNGSLNGFVSIQFTVDCG